MICMVALWKDAVLRQRDDVGNIDERCCTEDSETMCIVALMKDAVMRQRGDAHDGTAENYWMAAI